MLDLTTLTWVHTLLSLVAIVAGVVVVRDLIGARVSGGWTALYLVTAILTSVTGFLFPFDRFVDSHWIGVVSLVLFALVLLARYGFGLAGAWRWIYALGMVITLWFLVLVLIAQLFQKVPALAALAPTRNDAPFLVAQVVVLALFAWLAVAAVRRFRPGGGA
jgi:hypothetical protein